MERMTIDGFNLRCGGRFSCSLRCQILIFAFEHSIHIMTMIPIGQTAAACRFVEKNLHFPQFYQLPMIYTSRQSAILRQTVEGWVQATRSVNYPHDGRERKKKTSPSERLNFR